MGHPGWHPSEHGVSGLQCCCCSVTKSWPHELQHAKLPSPSLSLGICSNSCPLSQWCYYHLILYRPLLLPSSFPRMRIFSNELALCIRWPKYWRFGFSISYSNNMQGWFPLELTGLISLLSKGLSRVFSNTAVQKHQFFGTQPSLWFSSCICTWRLEKPQLWLYRPFLANWCLCLLICCHIIAFLPRSKHILFISWLQSPSTWFWSPRK